MFKPNVTPLLLDQIKHVVPVVKTLKTGERVIVDLEHTVERVMLWFYLLINIGAFTSVATSYAARLVGWWLAYLIPLVLYIPLPALLLWLRPRIIMHKPGGSDLPNVLRVLGHCMGNGGIFKIGRHGWWDAAKPSTIAAKGLKPETHYNDLFVEDVKRTMQATGMFCFFPVQYWNDNGIGSSANFLSNMLTGNGVPNDVISNFNSLSIILLGPILNVSASLPSCTYSRHGPMTGLANRTSCSMASIPSCAGSRFTTDRSLALRLVSCSALLVASDTPSSAGRPTSSRLAANTARLTPIV
jgi:POT family